MLILTHSVSGMFILLELPEIAHRMQTDKIDEIWRGMAHHELLLDVAPTDIAQRTPQTTKNTPCLKMHP